MEKSFNIDFYETIVIVDLSCAFIKKYPLATAISNKLMIKSEAAYFDILEVTEKGVYFNIYSWTIIGKRYLENILSLGD